MRSRSADRTTSALSGAVVVVIVGITAYVAFVKDQAERAMLAAGGCLKVMEALYTPPPRFYSSCSDNGYCTTYSTQADPYMRSLWRCPDPKGGQGEFWRRTAEELP